MVRCANGPFGIVVALTFVTNAVPSRVVVPGASAPARAVADS
jgi:hypothetical protein